jgi:hypothetical protein
MCYDTEGGMEPGGDDAGVASDAGGLTGIEELLARPFDDALAACAPLRRYLDGQGDSRAEVEEEFRTH